MPSPHDTPARAFAHPGVADGAPWFDRVVALLRRQQQAYARLAALGERQRVMLAADDFDGLLSVLAQRQVVVDEIGTAAGALAPLRDQWTEQTARLNAADRASLDSLCDAVALAAREQAARDEQDRERLAARRREIMATVAGLARGRGAVAAYSGAAASAAPRFEDREV